MRIHPAGPRFWGTIVLLSLLVPASLFAQARKLRLLNVSYPFGGSTSFFWVAQRSGSFEKYGLKVEPIYIRGGRAGVQALVSGDVKIEMQGALAVISAWAHGAKDLRYIAAVGNRLDYILVADRSIKSPADLKGKRIGISQLGASTDFIARLALRRLGLDSERDVTLLGVGGAGERWAALNGGHVQATVVQPPFTLLARKAGFPILVDFSKIDFEYTISGVVTTVPFIRSEPETVMNFLRGLADGMDFYRDENQKDRVLRMLGDYFRSNAMEELEETRRSYSQLTPGLPWITVRAVENVIANDKLLAGMNLKAADMLDLSFLQKLAEERKAR
ncbi:MAG TPA: ABC transporter substrate-binding protein [candidate division Zixibacteria bacterium]|nr:ABC transporter substrate-binding protein [candidate division Zixibacteria bacterium]